MEVDFARRCRSPGGLKALFQQRPGQGAGLGLREAMRVGGLPAGAPLAGALFLAPIMNRGS